MSNAQTVEKSNRPPYRIVCYVGQTDRKFWEQNGVGFPNKKDSNKIVFTPPFDIKAHTPCMIVANDEKGDDAAPAQEAGDFM